VAAVGAGASPALAGADVAPNDASPLAPGRRLRRGGDPWLTIGWQILPRAGWCGSAREEGAREGEAPGTGSLARHPRRSCPKSTGRGPRPRPVAGGDPRTSPA